MTANMFEKGCLVQLSVSKWGGVKKIDSNMLGGMVKNTDREWLTASKKLVSPESLKPICKIGSAARNWLLTQTLPFPITGLLFIPRDLISQVDEELFDFKDEFKEAVSEFTADYKDLRKTAKKCLGDLFNEVDYPSDIASKFRFSWRFVVLDVPGKKSRILSPEVYAREQEKFIQTMEEARSMAIEALREEFAQMVEHISDRFSENKNGDPKIFKNSTVDSFYDYFQTFKERNIFEDGQLAELVERAQAILNGTEADQIRSNTRLKEKIRGDMTDIEASIAELFSRPRRRIVMD